MVFLVDTQGNSGLPSLHNALQSALSNTKSCLFTIGAVCSAVFKRNELYMFFDSHSHGKDGLSSVDGISVFWIYICPFLTALFHPKFMINVMNLILI